MATPCFPEMAPTARASEPKTRAISTTPKVAAASFAGDRPMPKAAPASRMARKFTRPIRKVSVVMAANWWASSRRRETGPARTRSRVPSSSSPATARAPKPTAKTISSSGSIREYSSMCRKPGPVLSDTPSTMLNMARSASG